MQRQNRKAERTFVIGGQPIFGRSSAKEWQLHVGAKAVLIISAQNLSKKRPAEAGSSIAAQPRTC
jgi:hypothetical protein